MIGRTGALRMAALLVIGDAILGGLLIGIVARPAVESRQRDTVVTVTTVAPSTFVPATAFDAQLRSAETPVPPSTMAAPTSTTRPATPPTTRAVVTTSPSIAAVTTTVPPTTAAPTTSPPTSSLPDVRECVSEGC